MPCRGLQLSIKKESLAQVFSCEFCEISKNTFSYRTPPLAASGNTFLSEVNILYNFNQDLHQITQQMCLSHLTDKILKGFDGDLLTGMILIDLPKAFDNKSRTFVTKT